MIFNRQIVMKSKNGNKYLDTNCAFLRIYVKKIILEAHINAETVPDSEISIRKINLDLLCSFSL